MKKLLLLFLTLFYFQCFGQGIVSEYSDAAGYFAKFGIPGTFINSTTNLLVGANRLQTVRSGVNTNPPTYPDLLLNPLGGNVGIGGSNNLLGKLNIQHDGTSEMPSLVITEDGADLGRIQFRNTISPSKYFEISAQPGAPGPLLRSFNITYFDGMDARTFFRFDATGNLDLNTGEDAVTFINSSATNPENGELRVGTQAGGQNVNILSGMRIYNIGETTYWDIKSTNNLTFGHKDDSGTIGDRAYIDSDGEYHQISDRRLKENIQPLNNALETVLSLNPVKYYYKHDLEKKRQTVGFIAQEVLEIFPEAVYHNQENDIYSLSYKDFTVLAVGAIQEQEKELSELIKEQEKLDREIEALMLQIKKRDGHEK